MKTGMNSARGIDAHTAGKPQSILRRNADGITINSCLSMEITILIKASPSAWNAEHITIDTPDATKEELIMRRAGMPRAYIFSFALNISKNSLGKTINIAVPNAIILQTIIVESFKESVIRFLFLAP